VAKTKAVGERGSWFAKVNGERLACVHKHWISGTHHCDPGYIEGESQWPDLLTTIKETGKVIVTKDDLIPQPEKKSGMAFNRTGYIAVFSVDNIEADETGLKFDLKSRICDLQG
jgi:hypothetical protein